MVLVDICTTGRISVVVIVINVSTSSSPTACSSASGTVGRRGPCACPCTMTNNSSGVYALGSDDGVGIVAKSLVGATSAAAATCGSGLQRRQRRGGGRHWGRVQVGRRRVHCSELLPQAQDLREAFGTCIDGWELGCRMGCLVDRRLLSLCTLNHLLQPPLGVGLSLAVRCGDLLALQVDQALAHGQSGLSTLSGCLCCLRAVQIGPASPQLRMQPLQAH